MGEEGATRTGNAFSKYGLLYRPLPPRRDSPRPLARLTGQEVIDTMTRFQRIVSTASILGSVLMGYGATAMASPDGAVAAEHAGHEHGHKHRHGRGDLVRASLRLESLTPAQRQQIEALVTQEKA